MSKVTEKAFAKLNLCLDVGERAANGYHYVKSVMQAVDFCDTLYIEPADGIVVECDDPSLPCGGENLAYRAAEGFFRTSGIKGGARIRIEKRIPVCAGLGGGSSDAAAVLRALNRLYGKPLGVTELLSEAATLGADVPFCVIGGTAYADGFGERITPLADIRLYYVLVPSAVRLSTPQMYALLDEGARLRADTESCVAAVSAGNALAAAGCAGNSFLPAALGKCPQISESIRLLRLGGAVSACITGKGPTAFGVFADKSAALDCAATIPEAVFCESVPPIEYIAK